MIPLKQCVKQVLIEKQHKAYDKKLSEKRESYSDWIKKQEKKLLIDDIIVMESDKCLTNDSISARNDGEKYKNEGFLSRDETCCRYFEAYEKKHGRQKKTNFLAFTLKFPEEKIGNKLMDLCQISANKKADVILFILNEGKTSSIALPLIYTKFKENENIIMIYGDEDVEKEGVREKPWFKPDFSPDTFLSYFYFGSLIAIRAKNVEEFLQNRNEETDIYSLCYELSGMRQLSEKGSADLFSGKGVCHIPEVLFHGREEGFVTIKNMKLPEETLAARTPLFEGGKNCPAKESTKPLISVIIPSKDNPGVLFTCIHSMLEKTKSVYPYEILVVDNGSNEENRQAILKETENVNVKYDSSDNFHGMRYYYEPMPFNFSKMCNLGAALADGELYLFLNDDMEIIQENWLTSLADKAVLSYAGAVGAKLLYPDSDIIQHAGITNLRVGPAHKLQFLSDREVHYYGKNRFVHDVMAVTGACLLVRKEIFDKAGGFATELAVAFNDVDLCYTIFEMGYYNIVRNDVILYHHESLSRGKDGESEEKQQRLLKEKDILYERHQDIYGKDPFYHKYLTTDMLESDYSPALHYQVTLDMQWSTVAGEEMLPSNVSEDKCVVLGMECAMDIYKWKYGVSPEKGKVKPVSEDMGYYFQGYSFIIGADNACYKKTLLLQNKENMNVLKIPICERYRPDIKNNLKDQLNVDLTGFAAKVQLASVPEGTYRFGMLAEDRCSRQKLVNYSSWVLQVGDKNGL